MFMGRCFTYSAFLVFQSNCFHPAINPLSMVGGSLNCQVYSANFFPNSASLLFKNSSSSSSRTRQSLPPPTFMPSNRPLFGQVLTVVYFTPIRLAVSTVVSSWQLTMLTSQILYCVIFTLSVPALPATLYMFPDFRITTCQ